MNADAVAALREALHDRHLDSEANGCDHHADEYGESLQCRDEAEALLAHPSFAALAAAPLPSESHYECWFCKGQFVEDALIAGYDTFDEQRLACLACNERMQGNWRPHAAPLPSDTPADGLRETLVAHYVTAIECDHDAKTDTIRCVCSVWTGTPQPSVGKAVEQWADHVLAALDGPRPAGPWTGDPADYDGDEGR